MPRTATFGWLSALFIWTAAVAQPLPELTREHPELGGDLALFSATVIEGGGSSVSLGRSAAGTLEIHEEFLGQLLPPGRVAPNAQPVIFKVMRASRRDEPPAFAVPPNGTRIIAFGSPGADGKLEIAANHVYADTEHGRHAAYWGSLVESRTQPKSQEPLFALVLGAATLAILLAWVHVAAGGVALAISVVAWLGYETTIPSRMNIRVDLLLLLPAMFAAAASVLIAAFRGGNKDSRDSRNDP